MSKIRIIDRPLGSAPEHIREQWVGVEIPLVPKDNSAAQGLVEAGQGYVVRGCDAVEALSRAGDRSEAVSFWGHPAPDIHYVFARDCCEEV